MPGRVIVLCFALFMTGHGYARTVKSLEIEAVGQHDENLKNEAAERACKRFKPTKNQLIRFFNRAYPVEADKILHERYSNCYAYGSLRFSDDSFGAWVMYSSGVARFTFNKGDVVYLFYKNNKWHDPNACTYGFTEEGEC